MMRKSSLNSTNCSPMVAPMLIVSLNLCVEINCLIIIIIIFLFNNQSDVLQNEYKHSMNG